MAMPGSRSCSAGSPCLLLRRVREGIFVVATTRSCLEGQSGACPCNRGTDATLVDMANGRFAPSPSGPLHVGNLRTAMLAWLFARSTIGRFGMRMEDLTTGAAPVAEAEQLADLEALGLDWDGPVTHQSKHSERYRAALAELEAGGRIYPCFCTRREIREAGAAPHGEIDLHRYPGTCRSLGAAERTRRAEFRSAALRLDAQEAEVSVVDRLLGPLTSVVDDFVLQRGDGVAAYNLAVVVDDAAEGVEEVVRGDDLWPSTPRQVLLGRLLGLPIPAFAHVPLVLGPLGERLAKRDGAVTLADRRALGESPDDVRGRLARSLGLAERGECPTMVDLLDRFDPAALPAEPWTFDPSGDQPAVDPFA